MRCQACGSFVEAGDRFCWSCGTEQERAGPPHADKAEAPIAPIADPNDDLALLLRRAQLAQQRGNLHAAEEQIRAALAQDADSVPALSMLAAVLRARGDRVGSVAAAQRVGELSAQAEQTVGAVDRAREDRARIEQQVVAEVTRPQRRFPGPLETLIGPASRPASLLLAALGAMTLLAALLAVAGTHIIGHLWLGANLAQGGWCYQDAENRRLGGLGWALFVLCFGPFGMAIYLHTLREHSSR